jgi:DUF4097 and DUF4098 domain-containing protein YvlB
MRRATRRRALACLATAATGAAGCLSRRDTLAGAARSAGDTSPARDVETRRVRPADVDRFKLHNDAGVVRVAGADRRDVQVRAVRRARRAAPGRLSLSTKRDGGTLRIVGSVPEADGVGPAERAAIDLTVRVPRSLPVTRVSCSAGDVTVRNTAGDLRVSTTAGRLRATNVDGFVDARGGLGPVEVRSVAGVDRLTAGTGRIDAAVPAVRGDTRIAADAGDVRVALPVELGAVLAAEAPAGGVSVDGLPVTTARTVPGERVTGTLGGGEYSLTIRSGAGDVTLERL